MLMFSDAMVATERLYENSVGVFEDCLTSPKEEAVVEDPASIPDNFAILQLLMGKPNKTVTLYSYDSDEEEVESRDIIIRSQEFMRDDESAPRKFPNLELLCSHEQYGFDMCFFLLSPNSPLHSPDHQRESSPVDDDVVVQENDTSDNDESWFDIDCLKLCAGKNYVIESDDKTAGTVSNSEYSRDGSMTIDDCLGHFYDDSSEEDTVPSNALANHLMDLIAKNQGESQRLEYTQTILSGEIEIPDEEAPEPVGRIMTQPSDDDYLMLLTTDPKGTSFCTDDSSCADDDDEEPEMDDVCRNYVTRAKQRLRSLPAYVPQEEFTPRSSDSVHLEPDGAATRTRQKLRPITSAPHEEFSLRHASDSAHLEPDGNTIASMDEVSGQSERKMTAHNNTKTGGVDLIQIEILAADLIQETDSVSSSMWSHRALLDEDDSILNEDSWEAYREPDGTKFADLVLSNPFIKADTKANTDPPPVDYIINAMSDDEADTPDATSVVFSEPFDETTENVRSSPRQQSPSEVVDGAHRAFELPHSREPRTNLEKRLSLLEKLRGLSDSDTDMLCACVQGCGDFADATFFEGSADGANQEEAESMEQRSLD
ncbi:MAG: hypothetical protein SGBAC_011300 [Bacillariaceae sp.]